VTAAPAHRSTPSLLVPIAVVVLLLCAILLVGETRYRSCIARAEAAFPAVPVSAFTGNATGPLKVSYVNERTAALDDCGRFF
jgi:hypothetical protein